MADGGILSGRVSFVGRPLQVLQAQNLLVGCCRLVTGEFYPAELVLPAVRSSFAKRNWRDLSLRSAGWGNWFYSFNFVGSPLPVSQGKTGEMSCERADSGNWFYSFNLSAVRFQFRRAKLARIVVRRRTGGIGFYRFNFIGSLLPVSRGELERPPQVYPHSESMDKLER